MCRVGSGVWEHAVTGTAVGPHWNYWPLVASYNHLRLQKQSTGWRLSHGIIQWKGPNNGVRSVYSIASNYNQVKSKVKPIFQLFWFLHCANKVSVQIRSAPCDVIKLCVLPSEASSLPPFPLPWFGSRKLKPGVFAFKQRASCFPQISWGFSGINQARLPR